MIGIVVYLNGKKLAVAGAEDLSVLNAIVNAVGKLGKSTARIGTRNTRDLWLSVSGLTSRSNGDDEHLQWVRMKRLRVGDKITVQVVRTDKPDRHVSATAAASKHEARKRVRKMMRDKTARTKSKTGRR